ncbi:MAG: putative Fe-S cluster assembly protein SufT [Verrucomicrobia bacterium]|jgi:probable FeS assembly SUF system protein SufT|nr:putative Fe-S cluster assembly protein SufT [Verrucomicrobiota bacterium]MBV8533715.1 putative Fe-S cluster assembly protein SufT [Verrucomicrobiota bacterium]
MSDNQEIELARDCDAIQIPAGLKTTIPAGTKVIITQSLGGSYTIACDYGLFRISEENAGALGLKPRTSLEKSEKAGEQVDEEDVWDQLRTVYDPEIPVNIVDLGLVYDCQVVTSQDFGTRVEVKMTLTAPGCGMGPAIAEDARYKILTIPGVDEADVELVWDPPWNQHMISETGKMKLGLI